MNIIPLHDQILVRRDPEDAVSTGGIIIPDAANNPKLPRGRGVVLAVGPGRKRERTIDTTARDAILFLALRVDAKVAEKIASGFVRDNDDAYEPMDVKVGDRVVFSKLSGDKVRDDLAVSDVDDDLLLIRESEVIAILESTETEATDG